MAEKQVEMDDWSKKIAEGMGSLSEVIENDQKALDKVVGIAPSAVDAVKAGANPYGVKDDGTSIGGKVILSGGKPLPGLDTMPALNTTQVPAAAESSYLSDPVKYEHAMRVANAFSKAKLLPELYQNDVASCFVALHMAERMQVDPLTFMQNSYVIKGKPAIEGKLMIAVLNARGGYIDGIEYEYSGKGDDYGCRAFGTLRNGKVHEARVDMKLVKAEGWYEKNSKWKNMPDQMLAYRSAAFLLRKYRPELLMGLQTFEEVEDVNGVTVLAPVGSYKRSTLNDVLDAG